MSRNLIMSEGFFFSSATAVLCSSWTRLIAAGDGPAEGVQGKQTTTISYTTHNDT
jgi:hypothetical protein